MLEMIWQFFDSVITWAKVGIVGAVLVAIITFVKKMSIPAVVVANVGCHR